MGYSPDFGVVMRRNKQALAMSQTAVPKKAAATSKSEELLIRLRAAKRSQAPEAVM